MFVSRTVKRMAVSGQAQGRPRRRLRDRRSLGLAFPGLYRESGI